MKLSNKYVLLVQPKKCKIYSTHELVTIKVKMLNKKLRSYFMHVILQEK